MKVLMISGSMPPMRCGVGGYVDHLVGALSSLNDCEVLLVTSSGADEVSGPRLSTLPVIKKWDLSSLVKLRKIARQWGPDVIHIQYPTTGYRRSIWPSLIPLFMRGIAPVVQTWHEYLSRKGLVRYIFNAPVGEVLVVVREKYRKSLPTWYRWLISNKRMEYIPVVSAIPKYDIQANEVAAIKRQYNVDGNRKLITYFGFVNEQKGVDVLFDVLDPNKHCLVLICELDKSIPLHRKIFSLVEERGFANSFYVTGYLPEHEIARILSASDGAVYPFRNGVEECNTSFLAARVQGVFVLATHREKRGYCETENVYYAPVDDVAVMKEAMQRYSGIRRSPAASHEKDWLYVAEEHVKIYRDLQGGSDAKFG